MELIQIIYDILIYGGCLLMCVVVISFILSRTKKDKDTTLKGEMMPRTLRDNQSMNVEQRVMRKNNATGNPQIFVLYQNKPREVKVVRTPTLIKRDSQVKSRTEENNVSRTNGNGKRYKFVNDEMEKSRRNVANFYS